MKRLIAVENYLKKVQLADEACRKFGSRSIEFHDALGVAIEAECVLIRNQWHKGIVKFFNVWD